VQRLIEGLARHPVRVVAGVVLVTLGAALQCVDWDTGRLRFSIDASIDGLLPPADADRGVYERARAVFGDTEAVYVAVAFDPVFTPEHLEKIAELTDRFQSLPGVSHVFSLATAPNLLAANDEVDVGTFTAQARINPERIPLFSQQLDENPIYHGTLVSADGRVTAFAISLAGVSEDAFRAADYPSRIRAIVREVAGDAPVWITGNPVLKAATSDALLKTLRFTVPFVFILAGLILYFAFWSLRSSLVAVGTIAMALVWTLATAAVSGLPLNLVTALVPPLVITLGLSYAVHVLSGCLVDKEIPGDVDPRVRRLERIGVPLLLTCVTTVAGFLALTLSSLPAIRHFALLSAAGVTYLALLSFLFVPAMLSLTGATRRANLPGAALAQQAARRLAAFDTRHRGLIIGAALVLVVAALSQASHIRVGTEYIRDFHETSQVRQDYEAINSAFNGANLISILIETHVNDALTDPALVRDIGQLQSWLREQPEIGASVSFVDHLKLINRSLHGGDPEAFAIPESATAIKQLLVFGGSEEIHRTIDVRLRTALITLRINVDGSVPISELVERIEHRLALLQPPLNARVTGSPVLAMRTVNALGGGQWQSLTVAMIAIWAMLSLLFTSPRAGLIALLPNVLPVIVYFGALGFTGIGLNPTTSLIACIMLGVAADDTIHYLARFNADAREKASESAAVESALVSVLRPISLTTLALILGFLALTFSDLRNQVQFGALAAFTLMVAWLVDVLLTPALGSYVRVVTLWDLLRLDLGRNPQHTIPLLSGLSLREARIFALMSRMERHDAGARVIQVGDWSQDMYVVVDGELKAWIERDGKPRQLATLGRGTVLGETGFFGQRRTANVDTLTPARLLRFDSQDLERLRGRYPRIAATIFRNLNRIQAERLARTTAMLQ
jgi:uncharacterized protein